MGRSLLIFSDVTFKMAAWRPYWIFWFPDKLYFGFEYQLQTSMAKYLCIWVRAYWFSVTSFSQWLPGGHIRFLAATKQLYEWFSPSVRLSVRPSVRLSHLFDYVPIILSSWNFQELLPVTKVTSMQKVKVRGQRSRSQRSQPNLTVSGL